MGIYNELAELDTKSPPPNEPIAKETRESASLNTHAQPLPASQAKTPSPVRRATHATTQPRNQARNQTSMLASYHDSLVETIRKSVKATGKEVSFIRCTQEEKNRITDILYTFKRQGTKTTENEINRIALNLLLEDYQAHGKNSVLVRVIAALLA